MNSASPSPSSRRARRAPPVPDFVVMKSPTLFRGDCDTRSIASVMYTARFRLCRELDFCGARTDIAVLRVLMLCRNDVGAHRPNAVRLVVAAGGARWGRFLGREGVRAPSAD